MDPNMRVLFASFVLVAFTTITTAAESSQPVEPYFELIPRCLLGLIHAPEVHAELKLNKEQIDGLELLFRDIDARWFPARILPADKQLVTVRELEQILLTWFESNTSADQQQRIQQLEYYAQSGRMLLRDDVRKRIGLNSSQQGKLAELAKATDEIQRKLSQTQFGDPTIKTLQATLSENLQAERAAQAKLISADQRQKLSKLLGPPFDPSKLKRINAKAPEFKEVEHWINSQALKMTELRGKVVLVHFYAFQCHNCHANFSIYQRWHRDLTDKGVVVIGIQTPETSAERDFDAVESAARERGLKFPILNDLDSENWKAWGNTMWPTIYVVDKNGYIRHWWQGELNWKGATADKTIEILVDDLLAEKS